MQVAAQPTDGQRDAERPPRLEVGDTARNVSEPRLRTQSGDVVVDGTMDVVGAVLVDVGGVVVLGDVVGVDVAVGGVVVDGDVGLVTPPPDPPPATVVVGVPPPGVDGVPWYVKASTSAISTLVEVRKRTITSTTIGAITAGVVSTSESPVVSARTTAASPNQT